MEKVSTFYNIFSSISLYYKYIFILFMKVSASGVNMPEGLGIRNYSITQFAARYPLTRNFSIRNNQFYKKLSRRSHMWINFKNFDKYKKSGEGKDLQV